MAAKRLCAIALDTNINIGLVAPTVYGVDKTLEDSARKLPTPSRIIEKLFGIKGIWQLEECNQPDWVAGMFMAFRSSVFKKIGGKCYRLIAITKPSLFEIPDDFFKIILKERYL